MRWRWSAAPVCWPRCAHQFPDWAARLGDDHVLDLSLLGQISDTR
jgi:7-cyano-7-deazaguanine synthase